MGNSTPDVNISLEPHLASNLQAIYPLLPLQYAHHLAPYITEHPPSTIPYNVLLALSQWARSNHAQEELKSKGLNPHDYSMISLLAGAVTSPERKFGDYVPPREPEDIEADRIRERKAITVLINALLSILGVAFAAWWAGEKTGWSNEVVCRVSPTISYSTKSFSSAFCLLFLLPSWLQYLRLFFTLFGNRVTQILLPQNAKSGLRCTKKWTQYQIPTRWFLPDQYPIP